MNDPIDQALRELLLFLPRLLISRRSPVLFASHPSVTHFLLHFQLPACDPEKLCYHFTLPNVAGDQGSCSYSHLFFAQPCYPPPNVPAVADSTASKGRGGQPAQGRTEWEKLSRLPLYWEIEKGSMYLATLAKF